MSVCVSVTLVHSVKTNKYIFKIFSLSGSHTILVFAERCYASAAYVVMWCLSVCLSVCLCLSRSWILSKRINIASKVFHHRVATPFLLTYKDNRTAFNCTPNKSVAYVTNNKIQCSTLYTIEITADRHARPLCDSRATCLIRRLFWLLFITEIVHEVH